MVPVLYSSQWLLPWLKQCMSGNDDNSNSLLSLYHRIMQSVKLCGFHAWWWHRQQTTMSFLEQEVLSDNNYKPVTLDSCSMSLSCNEGQWNFVDVMHTLYVVGMWKRLHYHVQVKVSSTMSGMPVILLKIRIAPYYLPLMIQTATLSHS